MAAAQPPPQFAAKPKLTPTPAPSESKPKQSKGSRASPWPWGPLARLFVSTLVVLHLTAVFSAPWAIQLRDIFIPNVSPMDPVRDSQGRVLPTSALSPEQYPPMVALVPEALSKFFWHYSNLAYVNHGYDFFSPDPGVSHLIVYRVFDAQNQKIADGRFPDRREQWPRLFYHRHMMLADQSADGRIGAAQWEKFIARRLLDQHGGERVELDLLVHHLLTIDQAKQGVKLIDPSTYQTVERMQLRRGDPLPELSTRSSAAAAGPTPASMPAGAAIRIPGGSP